MAGEHGPREERLLGLGRPHLGANWVPLRATLWRCRKRAWRHSGRTTRHALLCCTRTPRCDSGGERFLLSFRGPSKPATSVADLGGGVYGFAYASAVSGPYVMSLTLHGVHLPGSPFTVTLGEHAT